MALIALQVVGEALNPVTFAAATGGGDTLAHRDNSFLVVKNGDAAPHTVTLVTPGTTHGLAIADEAITVAAGNTAYIAVSDEVFVNSSDGLVHVTYDGVTSVTVAHVAL